DLLDTVAIEVAVHNTGHTPAHVEFVKPAEYEIDVARGNEVIWSNQTTLPPGATFPIHTRTFIPGPSVLVVYVWNAIERDGSTPAPGTYTVTARLLGQGVTPSASAKVHFIEPVPSAAVEKLKMGDTVTIAGTLDATKQVLTDASGTIRLARRLITAPATTIAVRGYLMLRPDRTHVFFIQRWAPMQ
ncbi:MAG TPA: hypothetical protein VIK27_02360, partial [Candidatus Aquilonibacter sp.]